MSRPVWVALGSCGMLFFVARKVTAFVALVSGRQSRPTAQELKSLAGCVGPQGSFLVGLCREELDHYSCSSTEMYPCLTFFSPETPLLPK